MMARHDRKLRKKGRSDGDQKHVRIYRHEFNCEAFRDLDCTARCALLEFRHRFDGANNGFLSFSEREMGERLNVSRQTARKALRALVDHGFIRPMSKGAFTLKRRHATEWLLTNEGYPKPSDTPTKDYMRWRRPPGPTKRVRAANENAPYNVIGFPELEARR
jgi:hypothetical protein